jgi:hypothetical protein
VTAEGAAALRMDWATREPRTPPLLVGDIRLDGRCCVQRDLQ